MQKIVIIDLDNCIADDAWRISKIDWDEPDLDLRYHTYHTLSEYDMFKNRDIVSDRNFNAIFTARPNSYRNQTQNWLKTNGIRHDMLLMRPKRNHMHSLELKKRMLMEFMYLHLQIGPESIHCAYDDRPDVVEMYKSLGIRAEQRKIHDVCAYTAPEKK